MSIPKCISCKAGNRVSNTEFLCHFNPVPLAISNPNDHWCFHHTGMASHMRTEYATDHLPGPKSKSYDRTDGYNCQCVRLGPNSTDDPTRKEVAISQERRLTVWEYCPACNGSGKVNG
jgi:hypothetical protein